MEKTMRHLICMTAVCVCFFAMGTKVEAIDIRIGSGQARGGAEGGGGGGGGRRGSIFSMKKSNPMATSDTLTIRPYISDSILYDSNPGENGNGNSGNTGGSFGNNAGGGLAMTWPINRRLSYTFSPTASWYRYFTQSSYNHLDYSLPQTLTYVLANGWSLLGGWTHTQTSSNTSNNGSSQTDTQNSSIQTNALLNNGVLYEKDDRFNLSLNGAIGCINLTNGFTYTQYRPTGVYSTQGSNEYSFNNQISMPLKGPVSGFIYYNYSRDLPLQNSSSSSNLSSWGSNSASTENDIGLGFSGDICRYFGARVSIGYQDITYDNSNNNGDSTSGNNNNWGNSDYSGLVYSVGIQPYFSNRSPLTTHAITFSFQPRVSAIGNNANGANMGSEAIGFSSTTGSTGPNIGNTYSVYSLGYNVSHRLNRKTTLYGSIRWQSQQDTGSNASSNTSTYWTMEGRTSYRLAQHLSLNLRYTFNLRNSNNAGQSYSEQIGSLGAQYDF